MSKVKVSGKQGHYGEREEQLQGYRERKVKRKDGGRKEDPPGRTKPV